MKNKKFMDFDQKLDNALATLKRKCKCGHTKIIPYSKRYEYVICNWCGSRIYRDIEKQKKYDEESSKKDFLFKLNQCMNYIKDNLEESYENVKMSYFDDDNQINKKELKRKCFKNNDDYFEFCNNNHIKVYIVNVSDDGKIILYYGAKIGRPPKNKIKHRKKKNVEFNWRKNREEKKR